MNNELLDKVAWIGTDYVRRPVRGIVLRFAGLGNSAMKTEADLMELQWADAGALVVAPYHEPWAWMNAPTRALVDEIVDGLRVRHGLSAGAPIIATGGSMGGHAALAYTMLSRHRVAACMANCPVCDLPYHYTERPDLPRTMHHAFGSYGDISEQLIATSPLHQVARLPDVPYMIIHGVKDTAVNKARHSDALVATMRARGLRVDYREQPNMAHCGPLDWPLAQAMLGFVLAQLA